MKLKQNRNFGILLIFLSALAYLVLTLDRYGLFRFAEQPLPGFLLTITAILLVVGLFVLPPEDQAGRWGGVGLLLIAAALLLDVGLGLGMGLPVGEVLFSLLLGGVALVAGIYLLVQRPKQDA